MIRSVTATAVFALVLASSPLTPALAKQIHKHPPGKSMAGHATPGARPGIGIPEPKPLTPAARDAEQAINWQSSLHGEID